MMSATTISTGQSPVARKLLPYFFLMIFFGCVQQTSAQTSGTVSGAVIMADKQPLIFASVALHHADGQVLKGTLTDTLGMFSFSAIPEGHYLLKITSIGFKDHESKPFILSPKTRIINLGKLTLFEDARLLSGITINAQKKLIEQNIDRTVINVENSILSEGNTALELLERAPGVSVDQDGKISLKGRPGVMVMINGKSTYLSPKELSTLLKATNSNSISKIEIMSNPSAKYDAAGNGGIINIQMKKNTLTGFNGTVSLNGGAGRNARYGSGLGLNYKTNSINIYGSYDYGYRGETEYLDFVRNFYNSGIAAGQPDRTSVQHTKTNEPLHTNNFRAGIRLPTERQ